MGAYRGNGAASGNVPRASIRNALTNAGISLVSIPPSKDEDVAPLVFLSLSVSLSLSLESLRLSHFTKPNKPRYSSWDRA